MFQLVLVKVWETLKGSWGGMSEGNRALGPKGLKLAPLPVAIRLDTSLPIRGRGTMETSRVIWVSPDPEGRSTKALEAVVCPN